MNLYLIKKDQYVTQCILSFLIPSSFSPKLLSSTLFTNATQSTSLARLENNQDLHNLKVNLTFFLLDGKICIFNKEGMLLAAMRGLIHPSIKTLFIYFILRGSPCRNTPRTCMRPVQHHIILQ